MLGLKKVTQAVESTSFRCGNEGIERQISDSYYATLLREGYGYEIVVQAETEFPVSVGYCMIKLVTLNKEHIPEEEQEYYSQVYANRSLQHSAIEITYLAVNEKEQGRGIGVSVLILWLTLSLNGFHFIKIEDFNLWEIAVMIERPSLCTWIALKIVKL